MRRARRDPGGWLSAGAVAVALGAGPIAAQAPDPPRLLAGVLRAHAEWRILDPTSDLAGDYTIAQLQELDRWPPWIEQDLDRDGQDDVAAVLVRRKVGSPTEFTVAVVHGATPERAELVVPFSAQRIFGVSEGVRDDTVMPLHCADCDANVDQAIRIGSEPGRRSPLFASPRPDAARTAEIAHCARAQVQEVGGEEGRRWYRVEVVGPQFPRGWVPAQLVMEGVECDR
jgi:hypothetical protein